MPAQPEAHEPEGVVPVPAPVPAESPLPSAAVMLRNELAGKHNAAQVYDERIWKIRTGFLTLTFASWGALLAVGGNLEAVREGAKALLSITVTLAVAGLAVDVFYVCRKSRCVAVINRMSVGLYQLVTTKQAARPEEEEVWLRFSGDDDLVKPWEAPLFRRALVESAIVYATPALGFLFAYWYFFAEPAYVVARAAAII